MSGPVLRTLGLRELTRCHTVGVGTDINLVVEERASTSGHWRLARRPRSTSDDPFNWYDDRNYECFSLLTGLNFCERTVRPFEPVATVRGLPDDLSQEAQAKLIEGFDDSVFGRSWLAADELHRYDWNQSVSWTYMTAAPDGRTVSAAEQQLVEDHAETHGRPPTGWVIAGRAQSGFSVTGRITRRELAGRFFDVVADMSSISNGDLTAVRCVFEFYR